MATGSPGRVPRDALAELERRSAETETSQLVILRSGAPVFSQTKAGQEGPLHTQSVTKLVVNVAIAHAIALGLIPSVNEPVHRWLPDWREGRKRQVLLRHLMGHTSGLACDWQELRATDPNDWLAHCRSLDVSADPGETVTYNNCAVMLLPAIVAAAAGRPFLEFVASEIFNRLGIVRFAWGTDRAGNPFGMSHLQLTATDLAKVGQLLLQRGRWEDARVFDATWLDACLEQSHASAPRFGLLLFRYPNLRSLGGFGHDGDGGQQLWVYPKAELVVARLRTLDERSGEPGTGFADLPNLVTRLLMTK